MEVKPFTTFTVGKPFPGEVPHREGAVMELLEIGLVVVIQFPEVKIKSHNIMRSTLV